MEKGKRNISKVLLLLISASLTASALPVSSFAEENSSSAVEESSTAESSAEESSEAQPAEESSAVASETETSEKEEIIKSEETVKDSGSENESSQKESQKKSGSSKNDNSGKSEKSESSEESSSEPEEESSEESSEEQSAEEYVPGFMFSYDSLGGKFVYPLDSQFIYCTQGYRQDVHTGIDISASLGSYVYGSKGTVTSVQYWDGVTLTGMQSYGNMVDITTSDGYTLRFAHLDTVGVQLGQEISDYDIIGRVGSTGNSTGPHLHFEVYYQGVRQDPGVYISGGRPQDAISVEDGEIEVEDETISNKIYKYKKFEYIVNGTEATIIKYSGTRKKLKIPSTINGYTVTAIEDSAFSGCRNLKRVVIPDSITYISPYAFDSGLIYNYIFSLD